MVAISIITNDVYLGIGISLIVLTAASIGMRIAISIRQYKSYQVDDWLSVASFAIVVAFYVFNEYQYKRFSMPPDLDYSINTGIAVPIMAAFSLWTSKAPVLLLYLRLFGVLNWMRYACWFVLVASVLGFIASLIPPLIQCHPFDTPHTLPKWQRCGKANIDAGITSGAVSVAADLAIMILPLRPIISLNLPNHRKVGVVIVFCSGILAMNIARLMRGIQSGLVASVVSLVYKIHLHSSARGDDDSILTTMLLQFVESAIALMVGCVPSIRGFWKAYVLPSKFYTWVTSLSSKLFASPVSRSSGRSAKPESGHHDQGGDIHGFDPRGLINRHGINDTCI